MARYRVRSLDKYQAYGDGRSNAWVKLHRKVLHDYEFVSLKHGAWRLAWECVMVSYDDDDRTVPGSVEELGWLLRHPVAPADLEALVSMRFLVPASSAEDAPPSHSPRERTEGEGDRDSNREVPSQLLRRDLEGTSKPLQKDVKSSESCVFSLPCTNGIYPVTEKHISEWQKAYPAVDIMGELQRAKVWCDANPTRRKTTRGAARFLTSWLTRAQDRPRLELVPQRAPEGTVTVERKTPPLSPETWIYSRVMPLMRAAGVSGRVASEVAARVLRDALPADGPYESAPAGWSPEVGMVETLQEQIDLQNTAEAGREG